MNEKLNQLLQAAILAVDPTISDDEWHTHVHDNAIQEKFAELIVRECAELTLDYKNDQHYKGWLDYRDKIKKHFGVEE